MHWLLPATGLLLVLIAGGLVVAFVKVMAGAPRVPATTLPQTFTSTGFIYIVLIVLVGPAIPLNLVVGYQALTQGHSLRDALLSAATLLFCGALVGLAIRRALTPDRLALSEDGLAWRRKGRLRHWAWDDIRDAEVVPGTKNTRLLYLLLRRPDPEQLARRQRHPWLVADPCRLFLGSLWKPAEMIPGEVIVQEAIRAQLRRRGLLSA